MQIEKEEKSILGQNEDIEKEVKISVLIKVKDMIYFLFYHNYTHLSGWIGVGISMAALIMLIITYKDNPFATNFLLIILASLFTVFQPINLCLKAAQQVKLNPMFKEHLNYTLNNEGIGISQGDDSMVISWEEVRKVIEGKNHITIYVSAVRAYILPKEYYEEQYQQVKEVIKENTGERVCKWK